MGICSAKRGLGIRSILQHKAEERLYARLLRLRAPRTAALLRRGFLADHPDTRTILVECASRFARDLVLQLTGHDLLKSRGIALVPADASNHFVDETPTAVMVRHILGAVSQFEKATLVWKLRVAHERKRASAGKCEGRKSHAEARPEVVRKARRHARKPRNGRRASYRKIAALLAAQGHLATSGKPFGPSVIQSMFAA